ncbi:hypothetical protein EJ07DRAFT_156124 [Lizonia empirigonia]|nr:hypothetical protein EJ07DRAFT_156124 [Lizonia empirigonia]
MESYSSPNLTRPEPNDADSSQATVDDPDLYNNLLSEVANPDCGDVGLSESCPRPSPLGTNQYNGAPELFRTWIDELKRDVARQSERISALEKENSNIKRVLAEYEDGFEALWRTSRERKRLLRRSPEDEGEVEAKGTTRKRKKVHFIGVP